MSAPMTAADAELVRMVPVGYKYVFLVTAYTKYMLAAVKMSDRERLQVLEELNSLTDDYFTPEMLAIIEPMGEIEAQMVHEANSLDPPDDQRAKASYDVLTGDVFRHFLALNPSILEAIRMREAARAKAAAPLSDRAPSW